MDGELSLRGGLERTSVVWTTAVNESEATGDSLLLVGRPTYPRDLSRRIYRSALLCRERKRQERPRHLAHCTVPVTVSEWLFKVFKGTMKGGVN